MTSQQFADIETTLQKWADNFCETESSNLCWGDDTVRHMAEAVRAVFDACEESQAYGQREGIF